MADEPKGPENVVFLAYRNPGVTKTDVMEVLKCGHCGNKTWVLAYDASSGFPRLRCACCGTDGGLMGWVQS